MTDSRDTALDEEGIDFVITWVDGSDSEWRRSRAAYSGEDAHVDSGENRYRDWDFLRYWFRSVEKNAFWVRKIHFVTCGQLPAWLDESAPKLNVVRHDEFIPAKYLPTFSSHPIELNMHRIEGLSERFVYFNDDMFLGRGTCPEDFFVGDKARDMAVLNAHCYSLDMPVHLYAVRAAGVINRYFDMRKVVGGNKRGWFSPGYGKLLARTLVLYPGCPRFPGFYVHHCCQPFLKRTFEEVWAVEPELLDETCGHRFREVTDVNPWLLRAWQLAKGEFEPQSSKWYANVYIDGTPAAQAAAREIESGRRKYLCLGDAKALEGEEFEECKRIVNAAFERAYPERSAYERY